MKKFLIKIDDLYYCGEGEMLVSRIPAGGRWYETYTEQTDVAIGVRSDAKVIEGLTNLNSHWKRIYDAMRYGDMQAYIQHKKNGWTDRRIMSRYGMNNNSLSKWKQENFTTQEIKDMSLRRKVSANNLPEIPHNKGQSSKKVISMEIHQKTLDELNQKNKDIKVLELGIEDLKQQLDIENNKKVEMKAEYDHAIQEYLTEKELAYQEAQEWHEKYKAAQEEIGLLKDQAIKDDYEIQNLKSHLEKTRMQLDELMKETNPLRKLLSIYLSREHDAS